MAFLKVALLLAGTAIVLLPLKADAARFTLLQLRELGQSVSLGYNYAGSETNQDISSSSHSFTETYGISGKFALLSPRLIKGEAGLSLNLNQQNQKSQNANPSSSSLFLGYNVGGVLFSARPYSTTVRAGRHTITLNPAFSRSYDQQTDTLNVALNITNKYLPARLEWARLISETSGLETDRRQSVNSVSASATHNLGISSTTLSASRSIGQSVLLSGDADRTDTANLTVATVNTLNWQNARELSRTITSSYSYTESAGFSPEKNHNISSNLQWRLGKALLAYGSINYDERRTESENQQQQNGLFRVSHRLFESLSTTISVLGSQSRFKDGSELGYGGGGGISYRKKLPSQSDFDASYSFNYAVSDRNRQNVNVQVENERHVIPSLDPKRIALANPAFLGETVTVRGAQTFTVYSRGTDFVVTAEGIEVLPGRIPEDSEVLVTYSYAQDPDVSYASISHSMGTRLTLYDGKHSVYATYRTSSQQVISGQATDITLTPATFLNLGFDSRFGRHSFGAEYGWNKNFAGDLQYLNSRWLYQGTYAHGTIQVGADDRLNWHGEESSGTESSWDNFFSLRTSYARNLSAAIRGKLGLSYLNSAGEGRPISNLFSTSLNLDGRFGKTTVTLSSSLSWVISSSSSSRSESAGIAITRFF